MFLSRNFFLYGEEILLSILSKEKGYENIYTPDLQVIHLAGVSTNKTHGKNSTKMEIYLEINNLYCLEKNNGKNERNKGY